MVAIITKNIQHWTLMVLAANENYIVSAGLSIR